MSIEKEFAKLKAEFEQYKKESVKWDIVDFLEQAKILKRKCSKKQAQILLEEMIRKHDCNYGITWETVVFYIEENCDLK